ncbi:Nn.00g090800.m01.CDS01 [Neocucurbitaria sp. VM-36]
MATLLNLDSNVVIVGGSISALMHALVLKSLGYNVSIFESRSDEQMQARAAGLSLWPNAQTLIAQYTPDMDLNSVTIRNQEMQIMNQDGTVVAEVPVLEDVRTSSWAVVHKLLRTSCGKSVKGHGIVQFHSGRRVWSLIEEKDLLRVAYKSDDGTESSVLAHLVIAADGARSVVRSQVLHTVKPKYAGYLAWRGSLPESKTPDELKGALLGKLVMFMLNGGYLLVYLTPNEKGSMHPGERIIEWCWYDPCDATSSTFTDFMTDVNGKHHSVTMPARILRPEVWEAQLSRKKDSLSPLWYSIFSQSDLPLLTAVHSFENSKASFFNGKLLLAGEAFTQIRPHLGASCDIAAVQALSLAKVLVGEKSVKEWEDNVAEYATEKAIRSRATVYQDFQEHLTLHDTTSEQAINDSQPSKSAKRLSVLEEKSLEKALSKGSFLQRLMLANDHQAGLMSKSPQKSVESSFISLSSLQEWGWRELRDVHLSKSIISGTIGNVLKIVGLYSTNVDEDKEAHVDFVVQHKHEVGHVSGNTWSPPTHALFKQYIDASTGIIAAYDNESPLEAATAAGPYNLRLPDLQYWSDVVYLQWKSRASDTSDLQYVLRYNVVNVFTNFVLDAINKLNDTRTEEWPGRTYDATSKDGHALLGTPNGSGVAYLLIQHKKQLGHKTIEKITVFSLGWNVMMLFHIKDVGGF